MPLVEEHHVEIKPFQSFGSRLAGAESLGENGAVVDRHRLERLPTENSSETARAVEVIVRSFSKPKAASGGFRKFVGGFRPARFPDLRIAQIECIVGTQGAHSEVRIGFHFAMPIGRLHERLVHRLALLPASPLARGKLTAVLLKPKRGGGGGLRSRGGSPGTVEIHAIRNERPLLLADRNPRDIRRICCDRVRPQLSLPKPVIRKCGGDTAAGISDALAITSHGIRERGYRCRLRSSTENISTAAKSSDSGQRKTSRKPLLRSDDLPVCRTRSFL